MYVLKREEMYFVCFNIDKGTKSLSKCLDEAYVFKNVEDCKLIKEELNKYNNHHDEFFEVYDFGYFK